MRIASMQNSYNMAALFENQATNAPSAAAASPPASAASQQQGGLTQLAQRLGVSTQALSKAFQTATAQAQASNQSGTTPTSDNQSAASVIDSVAQQLGIDPSTLQNAMQQVDADQNGSGSEKTHRHPHHGSEGSDATPQDPGPDSLAQQLGVSTQAVQQAFESAAEQLQSGILNGQISPGAIGANASTTSASSSDFLASVAGQLGVQPSVLQSAMAQIGMSTVNSRV